MQNTNMMVKVAGWVYPRRLEVGRDGRVIFEVTKPGTLETVSKMQLDHVSGALRRNGISPSYIPDNGVLLVHLDFLLRGEDIVEYAGRLLDLRITPYEAG